MENPATWGPAEKAVQRELDRQDDVIKGRRPMMAGLSLASRITTALREGGLLAGQAQDGDLAGFIGAQHFLVAALGDDGAWTTPVRVRCTGCQEFSPPFGGSDVTDGNGTPTGEAPLSQLSAWAAAHSCGPGLPPGDWATAGERVRLVLRGLGYEVSTDASVKAFASALQAVWGPLRSAARERP